MTKCAREISRAFDLIFEACENIKECGGCADCPLSGSLCLDDPEVSVLDLGDLMSASSWDEFLDYADNVTFSDEDLDAQYADFARKLEIEERMLDDEYYG